MKTNNDHQKTPDSEVKDSAVSEVENGEHDPEVELTAPLDSSGNEGLEEISPIENQLTELLESLKDTEAKAEEYLDGWQRARAEFANYKKRVIRENTDIHQVARAEVIKIFLDIVDDLERALQEKPQDGEGADWASGIEIIIQKLQTRLISEGITVMNPLGEEFDPNIHEALMKEESEEYESGRITKVIQNGYWIGDKLLRPALVRVAA